MNLCTSYCQNAVEYFQVASQRTFWIKKIQEDLLAILQKSLDRAIFLYIFIREAR